RQFSDQTRIRQRLGVEMQRCAQRFNERQLILSSLVKLSGLQDLGLPDLAFESAGPRVRLASVPYAFRFSTPAAQNLWTHVHEADQGPLNWELVANQLGDAYVGANDGQARYEGLLALALLLADIDRWEEAEQVARAALTSIEGKRDDGMSTDV